MAKRRAHELSKELGIEMKDLIAFAEKAGIIIKNSMASITDEDVDQIVRTIEKIKSQNVVEKRVAGGIIRRRAVRPSAAEQQDDAAAAKVDAEAEASVEDTLDAEPQSEPEPEMAEPVSEPEPASVETAPAPIPVPVPEPEPAPVETTPAPAIEPVAPIEAAAVEAVPETEAPAEMSAEAPPTDDEAERKDDPKRKVRKVKQISRIVARIDLADMVPTPPPAAEQRGRVGAPGGRPRPQATPNEVTAPVPDLSFARRRPGRFEPEPMPLAETDQRRRGKGTRKRQVIDDSYMERRGGGSGSGVQAPRVGGGKKKDRRIMMEPQKTQLTTPKASKRVIKMASDTIVVSELAKRMGIKANEIILSLMRMGLRVNLNQAIDLDTATLVANEFQYEVENVAFEEENFLTQSSEDKPEDLVSRWPVVTVMGHVDHGKTSILDYIRKTNVAGGEAGGITQHIGAYVVHRPVGNITFIDTPGHEAFTAMRARGAQVTDVVILVVAADDGVMPQTIEAINHARGAKVPIIVAVNKIDKGQANPERVRGELIQYGLVPEDFGGDTIMVHVSAKTGQGIDTLLEMLALQAEVLELKANPTRDQADAIVVESKLDRGRGPVATLLVRHGTLRVGDFFVCGSQAGRIKAMINDLGERVTEARPAEPVEVHGFGEVPEAGDVFNTMKDEKQAKAIADNRYRKKRETELAKTSRVSLEELAARAKAGESQSLPIVVKGDVQGTVEALRDALLKESTDKVRIEVIHTGVGGITESDVLFASASKAFIVGFNVRAESKAQELAEREGVEIKTYSIIYDALEAIRAAILGLLPPEIREEYTGLAEVRDVFNIPKVGTIAGCYILDGKAQRNSMARLLRDNVVVYTGKLGSLRRFKDDVSEVQSGYECGMSFENYNDVRTGDRIEMFRHLEVRPTALPKSNA